MGRVAAILLAIVLASASVVGEPPAPVGGQSRATAVSSARLAHAIQRLEGGSSARQSKVRYRFVVLLGGKITARIPT